MGQKPYFPELVAALRTTLEHLEGADIVAPDDPVMLQLKAHILRVLARQELESRAFAASESSQIWSPIPIAQTTAGLNSAS
jgi:hypothetical protein